MAKAELKHTLKKFRGSIWRAATKCVEFIAKRELVTEPKVGNFYVQICIEQQIFCLHNIH